MFMKVYFPKGSVRSGWIAAAIVAAICFALAFIPFDKVARDMLGKVIVFL